MGGNNSKGPKPTIYAAVHTTCSRRVICAAVEKDLDFEFYQIDMKGGEHKTDEFKKTLQPFGKMPVYKEGDFILFESRAIMKHIASRPGGTPLIPAAPAGAALMEQMISVEYSYFSPAFMPIYFERLLKPTKGLGETNEEVVAKAVGELTQVLGELEKMLGDKPYFAGDAFSLADLTYLPYFEQFDTLRIAALLDATPGLAAWWARCAARPAWQYARAGEALKRVPPKPETAAAEEAPGQ